MSFLSNQTPFQDNIIPDEGFNDDGFGTEYVVPNKEINRVFSEVKSPEIAFALLELPSIDALPQDWADLDRGNQMYVVNILIESFDPYSYVS